MLPLDESSFGNELLPLPDIDLSYKNNETSIESINRSNIKHEK